METVKIAIIGGSGLYNLPGIADVTSQEIDTPFGKPSSPITIGTLGGERIAFLARHGKGHVLSPASVPQRANIYALKKLGVRFIISVNAAGSLREAIAPGHFVVCDQLIDYNIGTRERSFFETGLVAHVGVADPFDNYLRGVLIDALKKAGGTVHEQGTFLIEDGPRFATRAESYMFRQWGCDVIGMTAAPEAFLAREAEIAYASIAHITDYDSWHEDEEDVNVEMVMAVLEQNLATIKEALVHSVAALDLDHETASHRALDIAIITSPDAITPSETERLYEIVKRPLNLG